MTHNYGPAERRMLETHAHAIYENAVASGYLATDDPLFRSEGPERAALDLLVDLGLLNHDSSSNVYVPMDPGAVQSRVVVPLGQQGAELLSESSRWAEAFNTLGQTYRRSPFVSGRPVTELHGYANINRFIETAVADCQSELLTAQPQAGRSPAVLKVAAERDVRALERGISMRTLYQHSARRSSAAQEYVAQVTAAGAEVRTLEEFFQRLIVVDRGVAVVPGREDGNSFAIAIHEKSLIDYLADIFERFWERARPFTNRESKTARDIAADVRAMSIRMLVEGHSDPASAKRIGVSTRTYAGYIASLKEEYRVQTRFQLGFAMGQRGGVEAPLPTNEEQLDEDDFAQLLDEAVNLAGVGEPAEDPVDPVDPEGPGEPESTGKAAEA